MVETMENPPKGAAERRRTLHALKTCLARIEAAGRPDRRATGHWRFGAEELDAHLAGDALLGDRLHEVAPAGAGDGAAAGFAVALTLRLQRATGSGVVLWCDRFAAMREAGALYGPGLVDLGLDPGRLIHVALRRDSDVFWAMEEGLKSRSPIAVVGEVAEADLNASRRLSLAAQETGVTPILIRGSADHGASAAWTRWTVAAAPSAADIYEPRAPGRTRWEVALTRSRAGARPQTWTLEWSHETHRFSVVAGLADRTLAPRRTAAAGIVERLDADRRRRTA
jgi:protein ImuA